MKHRRMAGGGHGLPKVSPGLAMPNPSTPCGQATTETALWPFLGWPACRASGLRPFSTPVDAPRHAPLHMGWSSLFMAPAALTLFTNFYKFEVRLLAT